MDSFRQSQGPTVPPIDFPVRQFCRFLDSKIKQIGHGRCSRGTFQQRIGLEGQLPDLDQNSQNYVQARREMHYDRNNDFLQRKTRFLKCQIETIWFFYAA